MTRSPWRETVDGPIRLSPDEERLERVALAIAKTQGFEYTGADFLGYAAINSRAAFFVMTAKIAILAYQGKAS